MRESRGGINLAQEMRLPA